MLRFVTAILVILCAILFVFAACSRSLNPLAPDPSDGESSGRDSAPGEGGNPSAPSEPGADAEIWGLVDVVWNPSTGELSTSLRTPDVALRHYKVSYFLTPPQCSDCMTIMLVDSDPTLRIGEMAVGIRNPTGLWAYDVRGTLRIPDGLGLLLLNADGYTTLFDLPGYQKPAPFRLYARSQTDHGFAPGATYSESYELKALPGEEPIKFKILVTAAHPSPAGDVSRIGGFRQGGQLLPGGGSATVSFEIDDLQDDITGVCLHASLLGAGDVWLSPSLGRWEAVLQNLSAAPGIHDLIAEAFSPNPQSAITSHHYRAVVFSDLSAYRAELLDLVNSDRAADGKSPLAMDPWLNTVAQFHAQDMSDQKYFSHTNLDGWTPWQRMAYYGVTFHSAGENIAVGQDTPSQVEDAWMNSAGHRANILSGSFKKIGLGIVAVEAGDMYWPGYYWVQAFTD